MIRRGTLFALICVAGASVGAMAGDRNRTVSPRRQLTLCMTRQMAASRTISYNAASAVCKAQLQRKPNAPALASSGEARPLGAKD